MPRATPSTDLEARIAAIRDNIRELTEQATAYSGGGDEARIADRNCRAGTSAGRASQGA